MKYIRTVKLKYTSRIINHMTTNNEKILNVLKETKGYISTTELAEKTHIDLKNISRYTKQLEKEGSIERKTIQNGKIRVVNISLRPVREVEKKIEEEKRSVKLNLTKTQKIKIPEPSTIPGQEPSPYKEEWVKDMPVLKVVPLPEMGKNDSPISQLHGFKNILIKAVNNYLNGYRNAYNKAKATVRNPEFSETIRYYEDMLHAKEFLEQL